LLSDVSRYIVEDTWDSPVHCYGGHDGNGI